MKHNVHFYISLAVAPRSNIITDGAVGNVKARDTCTVYGQKNVRTFDGKMFNIPTNCEYALMEFGDAKVYIHCCSLHKKFVQLYW